MLLPPAPKPRRSKSSSPGPLAAEQAGNAEEGSAIKQQTEEQPLDNDRGAQTAGSNKDNPNGTSAAREGSRRAKPATPAAPDRRSEVHIHYIPL